MSKACLRTVAIVFGLTAFCVPLAHAQGAGQRQGAPKSGAADKKPVFGGSGPNAGWGSIGVITKEAMKSYGWDVQICSACAGAERASRLVASAAVPKAGPNDPPQPTTPLDFGATGAQYLWWAYQGSHGFAKDPEGPRKQLRLIANIQSPSYLVVAVKADSGITDLAQIKEKRMPVRIFTLFRDGDLPLNVLAHYGITKQMLESFGGSIVGTNPQDRNAFDVIIGFAAMDNMPEYEAWVDVTQRFGLKYLELPLELRTKLAKDSDWQQGVVPLGLFRGVEHPIPAVVRSGTVIYGRDDMPDDLAYTLAKALDEHQDLFQWSNVTYSYNPFTVWKDFGVPLHPAAERYYRERGYMK